MRKAKQNQPKVHVPSLIEIYLRKLHGTIFNAFEFYNCLMFAKSFHKQTSCLNNASRNEELLDLFYAFFLKKMKMKSFTIWDYNYWGFQRVGFLCLCLEWDKIAPHLYLHTIGVNVTPSNEWETLFVQNNIQRDIANIDKVQSILPAFVILKHMSLYMSREKSCDHL